MDPALIDYLSVVVDDNSVNARKNIKATLEEELLQTHSRFINDYNEHVLKIIDAKLADLAVLDEIITDSIDKITINRERIGEVIDKSIKSKSEMDQQEHQISILDKFEELFLIDSSHFQDNRLDITLLDFMDKIEKKRANCKRLLEIAPNSNLAIESLHHSVSILEQMYEKIFLSLTGNEEPLPPVSVLSRCLGFLSERPHMQEKVLNHIVKVRADDLGEEFVSLLNNGLEANAFDSVRFVSDMLSWLMEHVAIETGFFTDLLGSPQPTPIIVDKTLSGVLEMIAVRFDSAITQTYSVVDLFKLGKILDYYVTKIPQIQIMQSQAWSQFQSQWQSRTLVDDLSSIKSLQPLPIVTETAFLLDTLLDIHSESSSCDTFDSPHLMTLLSTGIDPVIRMCRRRTDIGKIDSSIFFLNCVSTIQMTLRKYPVARESVEQLSELITNELAILVDEMSRSILKRVGLLDKLDLLSQVTTGGIDVLNRPEFHPISLSSAFKSFYATLFTQGISGGASHVDLLVTRELREEARNSVARKISDSYEKIYNVTNELGIAVHSPAQVRALLDIE